jgi:hypothetical protein|tara:strand:+ start:3651 stop:3776 length:126 start_codon:yes stop_codon:yes gene_type:complete
MVACGFVTGLDLVFGLVVTVGDVTVTGMNAFDAALLSFCDQ